MIKIEPSLSAPAYRASVGVSKSDLDDFEVCPAYFKAKRDGLVPREETPAMQYGTILHAMVLGGDAQYFVKPEGMTFASKDGKAWREAHQGAPIITQDQDDELNRTIEAIRKHRHASEILADGQPEVSLYGQHKKSGLAIKGRPDFIGARHIADVKTTLDASNRGLAKSIASFRYHVQAAMYLLLAEQNGLDIPDFYFIAIEKGPVPLINVRLLALTAIEQGRSVLDRQLCELAECESTGIWPDYSGNTPKPQLIDLPQWCYTNTDGMDLIGAEMAPEGKELTYSQPN